MKSILSNVSKVIMLLTVLGIFGCIDSHTHESDDHGHDAHDEAPEGPNGGRLLVSGDFALELSIFEAGVPPEYRVWVYDKGKSVDPNAVELKITLTRLGDVQDHIRFNSQADYLTGDTVIYEPHSFIVAIDATYAGQRHEWAYDNFEGRTQITADLAQQLGIATEVSGPATIQERLTVYGRVVSHPEAARNISARFDGLIQQVNARLGDQVEKGDLLAIIESNDSLKSYEIRSPIDGVVTARHANPGEQTAGRELLTVTDTNSMLAELSIFPKALRRVTPGSDVLISVNGTEAIYPGKITRINPTAEANQAVLVFSSINNRDSSIVPGVFLSAEVVVGMHEAPLAVKREGLQSFRDFTVVYALIGDEYEVRMLDLGRKDDTWIEVLGGLDAGTSYVTTNSYLIKADIEKSGASHDH